MPSFLTVRIYFKIPGKIYYQQYNEIITEVFFERFTITTVRGNRVMHKILKCSPVIMKNHVLNWCQWSVKLSLLDLSKLFVFLRWRASWRIEIQPSESKGFLILHDHFSLRLDTKRQTIKKVNGGEPKKKIHTSIIHVRRCIQPEQQRNCCVWGVHPEMKVWNPGESLFAPLSVSY